MSSTHDLNRLANLKLVKQQLFNHDKISRADVARNTGITRSTISSIFNELDTRGYIKHLGRGPSMKYGGRKPELYTFNTQYGYIACFNLTYDSLYVMFLYIDGKEISFQQIHLNNRNIFKIINIINLQLASMQKNNDTKFGLLGISLSIHAVVEKDQIIHSPYYSIQGINIKKYFQDRYHVPVKIGNEANLAAIFERDYIEHDISNFIVLSIHRGPGIGVIANKQLFTGYHGMVGELGSVKIYNESKELIEMGDIFSSDHFKEQLEHLSHQSFKDFTIIQKVIATHPETSKSLLKSFANSTGQLLFNLQMIYGPEKILINSPFIELLPSLGKMIISEATKANCQVPVTIIKGSKYVSLLGAGSLLSRQILDLEDIELRFKWSHEIG